MATLADLFVSYKSVQPTESKEPVMTPTRYRNLQAAQGRLHQIEALQQAQQNTPDQDNTEPEGDPQENPWTQPEFSWFAEQFKPKTKEPEQPVVPYAPASEFTPSGTVTKYSRGQLDKEIKELFDKAGINVTVTSGKRKAGAVGKAGARSHHVGGNAVDIVPGKGETFDSIRTKMINHPEILQFFHENGLGVIDETTPENMAKTGATGKHFHIGPDQWATRTWGEWTGKSNQPATGDVRQDWARNTYNAFVSGLKKEYGKKYDNSTYNRIAAYMTYQAALESGYGQKANGFNYAGHMRDGKTINYKTMDEFVKAHIKTLKKWDIMNAKSLEDYVNSLYVGNYQYNPSDTPAGYYQAINGTTERVNRYLGLSAKFGGKFTNIRQMYEENFG